MVRKIKDIIIKIIKDIINLIENNKKKTIIGVVSILVGIFVFIQVSNNLRKNMFMELFNNTSSGLVDILDHKSISGDAKLKISLDGMYTDKEVIKDMNYLLNYQVDLEKGYINIEGDATYDKEKINNNIYIHDSMIYIMVDEVYDKYISISNGRLDILNNTHDYKNIVTILTKEASKVLKTRYFDFSTVKLNGEKVDKTTLNLTGKNYTKIKKKITKKLLDNEKFVKSLSNILEKSEKKTKKYIENFDISNCSFSIYTTKFSDELLKLELSVGEEDIIISKKKDKYSFKYYLRDGIMYDGYIKLKDNTITKISLNSILEQWKLSIEVDEFNKEYDKDVDEVKSISDDQIIKYDRIDEEVIDEMKENDIFNEVYDKYSDRAEEYNPPEGPEEREDLYQENQI